MDLGLAGKIAVFTGPGKGMGPAVAGAFAREGCHLILAGRDLAPIEAVAADARAMGVEALVSACDVMEPTECERLVAEAEARFGRVDILVNIAGGTGPVGKTAWETSPEEFDQIVRLNMAGCFNTMRAVLPGMVARRYGKIVNVGGTFGMRGRAGRMAYSASKWGLRGITKSTALEAGPHNVNVNCVAPGMVDGPRFRTKVMPGYAKAKGISEEQAVAEHAAEYAMRRISTGEDAAAACLFLASDASRQITGVDLPVDGGWAML
ncbi:SDR family NAD(P)-dependent oxidoreductase [Flavisphingomonas formosensis]|uniref:SDR family NAD(P)-dependent oxidoreductase n=1 Tax=Flavisphingomonas formosensis TaxID=861534 RepID=UPI0012F81A96|nr:SDR family NAD(P)-dependent oxidoreductase [Sphingomonas formosensis]